MIQANIGDALLNVNLTMIAHTIAIKNNSRMYLERDAKLIKSAKNCKKLRGSRI